MLWGRLPGIHTAQRGGTIQTPLVGFAPDDAPQGQNKLGLPMRVHGQLHALRDHGAADRDDGARHVVGSEIDTIAKARSFSSGR